jgi:alkaline phosphatase D
MARDRARRSAPDAARSCALGRRAFLAQVARSLALVAVGCRSLPAPPVRPRSNPFSLGVASGDPLPDGVVLWTRLAPAPLEPGGGLPPEPVPLTWQMGEDEGLRRVVRKGSALALPELGHAVHVELSGLEPGRPYWYRFECGGEESPVGRTRTAPAADRPLARVRFAYVSCQNYESGYFGAYRALLEDDLELLLHLGDYIYEGSNPTPAVRSHGAPEPLDLDAYRARYALYRLDADLRDAHAALPWVAVWDDHEVDNDYAGDLSQDRDDPQQFRLRRQAAYQAYYEHLPLRAARPQAGAMQIYQRLRFGDLLELNVLDGRQYRSDQPCGEKGGGGGQRLEGCAERLAPGRSMLGRAQLEWLLAGLGASRARWNAIAQQQLMAELDQDEGAGTAYWSDGWDGYAAERARLLEFLEQRALRSAVVLSGDIHSFWAAELRRDARSPVLASEFVGTSISSSGVPYERFAAYLPDNPHVRFFDSRQRGYTRCELTPQLWRTEFRALDTVLKRSSRASTLASFAVEHGRPGIQRIA